MISVIKSLAELERFIVGMNEQVYNKYLVAIERFLNSSAAEYFSSDYYIRQIAAGLGLRRRS